MFKLGMVLLTGMLGEQKNPREAISWLKRAAEQADEDNPHALHELARLYENQSGELVPYDPRLRKDAAHAGRAARLHAVAVQARPVLRVRLADVPALIPGGR